MKTYLNLVDGNYFVNYASHSAVADLHGPNGEPTGALHTFLSSLYNIYKVRPGSKTIVVFDGKHADFRHRIYPQYKLRTNNKVTPEVLSYNKDALLTEAERVRAEFGEVPDSELSRIIGVDLSDEDLKYLKREYMKKYTFGVLQTLLPAMGIPVIKMQEEADDVICILSKTLKDRYAVVCVTGDEDYVQMAKHGALVHFYREDEYVTATNFKDKYGFDISGFTLYKAIKGDNSDNISGVSGVGEKRATAIIQSMGEDTSISHLLEMCEDPKNSKNTNIQKIKAQFKDVKRNLRLMDLDYIDLSADEVMQEYTAALDAAKLNAPLVKKILYGHDLRAAIEKWLPLVLLAD